jgi:ribosomal protein S18 acetylase RimI-like enzyme
MTAPYTIEQAHQDSHHLVAAATLHTLCLPGTITSRRGAATIAGIYTKLVGNGHTIHLAINQDRVVGGIVVMSFSQRASRLFMLIHRPWSWWSALQSLGVFTFMRQILDIAKLQRFSKTLPPHDYIIAVYVDESFRGSGLGRQLVQRAIDTAYAAHVGLAVDTYRNNEIAQRLYQQLGFNKYKQTALSTLFTLVPA